MASEKLSARTIPALGVGKHNDGGGLWIWVSETSRKWVFRYSINGKRREAGLGTLPEVTLAKARAQARHYRELVKAGTDPLDQRKVEEKKAPTFTSAAAEYIRAHRRGWTNRKHARQWVSTMKTYARPIIGSKTVGTITTEDILTILKPIWTVKTETAKRTQGRLENIIDFSTARKWRQGENPARWRGHLDHLLPAPTKVSKVQHHPAMPWPALPALMVELKANDSISAAALRWLVLTATRTGETLGAQWSEVDIESAVWTIPASRMKADREHRVPLTEPMLDILKALPKIEGNPHLFPGARSGKPLSNMALLQLMRGMGHGVNGDRSQAVPHGFRSSFKDWAGETTPHAREVVEGALAHSNPNKVEAAYQRGTFFEKRRRLMSDWATFCTRPPATVTNLSTRQTG